MNMNKMVLLIAVLFGILLTGCVPFQDNFSCETYKGAGNTCTSVEDNIEYAVKGKIDNKSADAKVSAKKNRELQINVNNTNKDKSFEDLQADYYVAKNKLDEYKSLLKKAEGNFSVLTPYERERLERLETKIDDFKRAIKLYKARLQHRSKMAELLGTYDVKIRNQEEAPIVAKPKVLKVTILPYRDSNGSFHMLNHIYEILDKPRFIMGQYTYKKPENNCEEINCEEKVQKKNNTSNKNINKERKEKLTALEKAYNEKLRKVRQLTTEKQKIDNKTSRKTDSIQYGEITKSKVYLRPIPDYGKSEVTVLLNMKGVVVKVEKVLNEGEWYKINTSQYSGWLEGKYIKEKKIKQTDKAFKSIIKNNIKPTVQEDNNSNTVKEEKNGKSADNKTTGAKDNPSDMSFLKQTQGFKDKSKNTSSHDGGKDNKSGLNKGPAHSTEWSLEKIRKMMKEKVEQQ